MARVSTTACLITCVVTGCVNGKAAMYHIRVSEAERDRACAILREHYALGRLDEKELPTRLAAAQLAVTWGDLHALLADLPDIPGMSRSPSSSDSSPAA